VTLDLAATVSAAVASLEASFARSSIMLGREYASDGRVGTPQWGTSSAGVIVQATVIGTRGRRYQTVVTLRPESPPSSVCSCPVGVNCKHGVAVLLVAQATQARGRPIGAPGWQRALATLADADRQSRQGRTPLALQVERGYADAVQIRPLMRGNRDRWIKTGAGWDDLQNSWRSTWIEAQRAPLAAIGRLRYATGSYYYGYGSNGESLSLERLGSQVWPLLRQAADAGVELVPGRGVAAVRVLDEPAELVTRISADGAGVVLTTTILAEGRDWSPSRTSLIGDNPGHGVALTDRDTLVLGGFAKPLSAAHVQLALANRRIVVPRDDLVSFATGYLPALRRTTTVVVADDVDLPAVSAPTLTLAVTFLPGHITELHWGFRYRAGGDAVDVPAEPGRDDPPFRDPDAEGALAASLPFAPWAVEGTPDAPHLRPHHRLRGPDAARFVEASLPELEARDDIDVTLVGERPDYRYSDSAPAVRLAVTDSDESGGDWFNLDVQVSLDGEEVAFAELFAALASGETHLILDSGTWFSLDRPELEQLRAVIAEASMLQPKGEKGLRLRAEHAGLWEELVALGVVAEQSAAWQRAVAGLLDAEAIEPPEVPVALTATLRPYQRTGFGWLTFLWRSRLGGILADDMGLGKTVQLLAAILQARLDDLDAPPVLVLAPTSVLSTWASQAAQFAPGLRVEVVERTVAKRGETLAEVRARADVVVTSYTLLRLGDDEYAAEPWGAVILDEAQFVKNRQAATYKAVRRLRAQVRFAVTGTPLENSLMDLWSMLSIATPGLFPDPESFTELYRRPIERGDGADELARLRRRVRPVMLRRTKAEVATELPPKQEQVLSIPLAPGHRRTYDRHLAAVRKQVLGLVGDLDHNRIQILAALTQLRQLALSPALLDDTAPPASAKIDALVELVADLTAEGHRGLVFSQFTGFLSLVRDRLDAEGVRYSYLDGRTRDREWRIQHFRSGDDPLFLISLKAGGFGLTLTEADYVFILDPWWNPAAENQAVDRTHRIGQDATVMVYRLVSEDTIEEKVVALQQRKRDLFDSVVGDGSGFGGKLTAADIRALLEPGG